MEKDVIYISPNFFNYLKFITLPVMVFFAYTRNEAFFLIIFIANCLLSFSDLILVGESGMMGKQREKLATITDIIFFIALSLSYYLFFPQFSSSVAMPFFIILLIWLFNRGFALYKFRRIVILRHLSIRVTSIAGLVFMLISMLTGNPYFFLFVILILMAIVSVVEEFLILRKMQRYDERIDSLLLRRDLLG
jgi:hypothetical protein